MCFVDDNQVEMARTELGLALLLAVDQVHHGRIGGEKHATFAGALVTRLTGKRVRVDSMTPGLPEASFERLKKYSFAGRGEALPSPGSEPKVRS